MRIRIPMRLPVLIACAATLVAGCAQPWQQYQAGQDESAIVARMGPPREIYDLPGGGKRMMWPTQPMGEITIAADIDAAHRIVNVRQVLQPSEFYRAEIGKWTKTDVLVNFGRPVETSYFPLMKREVWTYRYLEDNVWYMMYSFYFDPQGILRTTQKTPIRCTTPIVVICSELRLRIFAQFSMAIYVSMRKWPFRFSALVH
jgi:hypothetical protein